MIFRRLLVALVLVSPAIPAQQNPAGPPEVRLGLSGYLTELENWQAAAARLREHPEKAAALRQTLPRAWSVSFEGQQVEVPNGWLAAALETIERNQSEAEVTGQRIGARLQAMRAEAALLAQPSGTEPQIARSRLAAILERREFQSIHQPTWLERLPQRIGRWLTEVLEPLLGRFRMQPKVTRWLLWVVVVGLVLVSLAWLARFLLRRPPGASLKLREPAPPPSTWQALARQALAGAKGENYRDAIRLAYWAGVYRLEEAGVWQVDQARTHREYLRLLPEGHPQSGSLSALTVQFERIWYGGQVATSDQFRSALVQLEELGCLFPSTPATASS